MLHSTKHILLIKVRKNSNKKKRLLESVLGRCGKEGEAEWTIHSPAPV